MGERDTNTIVLIGMPGAGKSTMGVVLAKILNLEFVDADLVIQREMDKTLQRLLDACGPDGFIQVENKILSDIELTDTVLATGGSAVYSTDAMEHLRTLGPVVYLQVSYEELNRRLADLDERGVVVRDGMTLRDVYDERIPLYERYADLTIPVDGLSITEAARATAAALEAYRNGDAL